jgi:hypothetical protein
VVNATPPPLYHREREPVPIVQEAEWFPGRNWTGAKNLAPTGIRSPDHPAPIESLSRPAVVVVVICVISCLQRMQTLWPGTSDRAGLVLFISTQLSCQLFSHVPVRLPAPVCLSIYSSFLPVVFSQHTSAFHSYVDSFKTRAKLIYKPQTSPLKVSKLSNRCL